MKRLSLHEWIPMLPWPVCPLAGHAKFGQNVVVGSMLVLRAALRYVPRGVCLDPHFHCKRTIPRLSVELPGLVIAGDSLFSKQPFISDVGSANMHYIFVAKPTDHICMMAWLDTYGVSRMPEKHMVDEKGHQHIYTWLNDVPLNGHKDTLRV